MPDAHLVVLAVVLLCALVGALGYMIGRSRAAGPENQRVMRLWMSPPPRHFNCRCVTIPKGVPR